MSGPQISLLPCGRRLHIHHGPIDLIVEAFGSDSEISKSYNQASEAFQLVLSDLAEELPVLRSSDVQVYTRTSGPVAQIMSQAVAPHSVGFVTPMAAVAGSVAEYVLGAMMSGRDLTRAYVNNGGDCALYLSSNESFNLGASAGAQFGTITVSAKDPVRGVATSGWHGRSHSLGIADSVTVLAQTASQADVAATLIANAVDLPDHPAIKRVPACDLNPDSDLGERRVTQQVGTLSDDDVALALERGVAVATDMKRSGLIVDSLLALDKETRTTAPERILENA